MRLFLINPSNPLVSIVKVKESRWNRFRVWKPLSLMVLAGLTPPEWEITIVDENLSTFGRRFHGPVIHFISRLRAWFVLQTEGRQYILRLLPRGVGAHSF